MDRVTAVIDRKSTFKLAAGIYGVLAVLIVGTLIGIYGIGNRTFVHDDTIVYQRVTAAGLIFMGYLVSFIVYGVVGKDYNYTDCLRVRRGYSYYIRKRTLLIYSPIFTIPILFCKMAASYESLSEGGYSFPSNVSYLLICYIFYWVAVLYIGTVITLLNKVATVLIYAITPWIICQLSIAGICKDIISHENMLLFLAAALLIAADTFVMMGRLKKRVFTCDYR